MPLAIVATAMPRRCALITVTALVALLGASAALGSNSTPPVPVSPAPGGALSAGHAVLVVSDPGLTGNVAPPVFLVLSDRRRLVHGVLKPPLHCVLRCDYEQMVRWHGHAGLWIFQPRYRHHGYWAVTPGRYWWQTYHYAPSCRPHCILYSPVQSFTVVR